MNDIHGFTFPSAPNLIAWENHTTHSKCGSNLGSAVYKGVVLSYANELTNG